MLTQLFLAVAVMAGPPLPPGYKVPRRQPVHSPKFSEHQASLGRPMARTVPRLALVPPFGFLITNIVANGGNVILNWSSGQPPYQVQGSDLSGAWTAISGPTMANSRSFPEQSNHFFRVQGSIVMPFTATLTNNAVQLQWANPDTDMSDTLIPLRIYKASQIPDGDTPDNFAPPWTEVMTLNPADPQPIDATETTDSAAPSPTTYYKIDQTTVNGVRVPHPKPWVSQTNLAPGSFVWASQAFGHTTILGQVGIGIDSQNKVFTGGFLGAATTWDGVTFTPDQTGWLPIAMKLDSGGRVIFGRSYGDKYQSKLSKFIFDSSDNPIVIGTLGDQTGSINIEGTNIPITGGINDNGDGFILKLSPTNPPSLLSYIQIGTTSGDFGQAMDIDAGDNIVAAFYLGAAKTIAGGPVGPGAILVKFNPAGVAQWAVNLNANISQVNSLSIHRPTGDIYLGSGVPNPDAGFASKIYFAKYNTAGALQWERFYGTTDGVAESCAAVAIGNDGALYATGSCRGGSNPFNNKILNYDQGVPIDNINVKMFFCRLSPTDGSVIWGHTLVVNDPNRPPVVEAGTSLAIGDGGNVFFIGNCKQIIAYILDDGSGGNHLGPVSPAGYMCSTTPNGAIRWGYRSSGQINPQAIACRNGKLAITGSVQGIPAYFDQKDISNGSVTGTAFGGSYFFNPFVAMFNQ